MASRNVSRLMPSCAASSRSAGNRSPGATMPSLMIVSSRSTVSSNALPSRTGRSTPARSMAGERAPAGGDATASAAAGAGAAFASEPGPARPGVRAGPPVRLTTMLPSLCRQGAAGPAVPKLGPVRRSPGGAGPAAPEAAGPGYPRTPARGTPPSPRAGADGARVMNMAQGLDIG